MTASTLVAKFNPITQLELEQIALKLQEWQGAQLQECLQTSRELGLGFYRPGGLVYLWCDFDPREPMVVALDGLPRAMKKIARPFTLFVRSHFDGKRLSKVEVDRSMGRVLKLIFEPGLRTEAPLEIELRLFPHGQNAVARSGKRSVSEYKLREIAQQDSESGDAKFDRSMLGARPWSEITAQWQERRERKTQAAPLDPAQAVSPARSNDETRAIEKKRRAIEALKLEIESKQNNIYRELGEWLKTQFELPAEQDVPEPWRSGVNFKLSLAENIEACFRRAKDLERKVVGTRARLEKVEKELEDLVASQQAPRSSHADFLLARSAHAEKPKRSLLEVAEARGRRHVIDANSLEVFIGKSAHDNLAILRRAQPFDYWLHLRDQAGAHAILRRTRHRVVTDREFALAGQWVAEQSLGKSARELAGQVFEIVIAECRFVKPIRGDRVGRVNYSNDRTLRFRCS
jgi:predicted ribosome quality control (RQC) complex YloA/Tae2 family protein